MIHPISVRFPFVQAAFVRRVAAVALALIAGAGHRSAAQSRLALVGGIVVGVIDGRSQAATVLIDGDRITAVGAGLPVPAGTRTIDIRGKWLIPGLWDSHVHLTSAGAGVLPTLLAFGITSVRDLGGDFAVLKSMRDQTASGAVRGPRIRTAGLIIENAGWLQRVASLDVPGIRTITDNRFGVDTPADADRAVDSLAAIGVDLIKIRNAPRPETFAALIAAARRHRLPVAAHQPGPPIGFEGGFRAGLTSIEHIEGLGEIQSLGTPAGDSLQRAMAAAPFWITPTLITSMGRFASDSETARVVAGRDDSLARLVTGPLRTFWEQQLAMKKFDAPRAYYEKSVRDGMARMKQLARGGVKLLAGSDLGATLVYPGLSIHQELALMVDSLRLTPMAALRTATVEPARFFGAGDSLGAIRPGFRADLVVLSADPLTDIRNTRRITAVVSRGRWIGVSAGFKLVPSGR